MLNSSPELLAADQVCVQDDPSHLQPWEEEVAESVTWLSLCEIPQRKRKHEPEGLSL